MAEVQDPTGAPSGTQRPSPNDAVTLDFPFVIKDEWVPDIADLVFRHFDTQTLLSCRAVSKQWKQYIDSQTHLWNKISLMKAVNEDRFDVVRLIIENKQKSPISDANLHTADVINRQSFTVSLWPFRYEPVHRRCSYGGESHELRHVVQRGNVQGENQRRKLSRTSRWETVLPRPLVQSHRYLE